MATSQRGETGAPGNPGGTVRAADRNANTAALLRGGPPPRGSAARPAIAPEPYRYTIADLEAKTGLPPRTIRYYIGKGLLPPAHGRGPSATYDLGHLLRLRAIALLREQHIPLEEIKERLDSLHDRDIAAMLEIETAPPQDRWRRVQLHPDIELHIREADGKRRDYAFEQAIGRIQQFVQDEIDRLETIDRGG
ncbi:MAG TPA: MerR family transcriptional regulator [Thermomicrobiales bacterium]|jgi:DNA-binding transcriptional MerR regulator|nr:MerR family transcriptional regulator [Thermomicrobiales bacterium]